jgi:head-tail adaptor
MPRFNPGQFRHQVDVYLPSTTLDGRGRRTGDPTLILSGLPCSIEQLQALELIRAQKIWAEATHRVRCLQDPLNPLSERHYLLFGTVVLNIGAIVDADNTGIEVECLCKEERGVTGSVGTPVPWQQPTWVYLTVDGSLVLVKINLAATRPPTVDDDSGDGYSVGSVWLDTSTGIAYACESATAGAAIWFGGRSVYEVRADWVSPYAYTGTAPLGSSESVAVWNVTRTQVLEDGDVTVTRAIGIKWASRLTAVYM